MSDMREQFENWASAPPREFDVERVVRLVYPWPVCYRSYKVQVAWEAWQAAQEAGLVADLRRQLEEARKKESNDELHLDVEVQYLRVMERLEVENADLRRQLAAFGEAAIAAASLPSQSQQPKP